MAAPRFAWPFGLSPGCGRFVAGAGRKAARARPNHGSRYNYVKLITMVVRRRRLAAELKRLREAARLTCEETAARLECSASKISRIESGQTGVSPRDVRDLLRVYGVPEDQRESLIELAREARQKGWWQTYSSVQPHLATYLGLEHAASQIRLYRTSRVPTLLQTPDYARSFFSAARPGAIHPGTEQSISLLIERQRQAALRPPALAAVLSEAAVRYQPGSPDTHRGQLAHLLGLASRPATTIQVLTYNSGLHITQDTSFTSLSFPDPADPDIVCVAYPTGLLWVEEGTEVSHYNTLFGRLQAAALSPEDSAAFITTLLEQL
jgi:transcriptional regulator with XRE-family HTH domain